MALLAAAEEPTTSLSDAEQLRGQPPGSGASWSSEPRAQPQPPPPKRRPDAAAPRAAVAHHLKFEALQTLSGALAQQLQATSPRGPQLEDGRPRGAGQVSGSGVSAFAEANRLAELGEEDNHSGSCRPQRSALGARAQDGWEDEQDNMQPYTPTYLRKAKGLVCLQPRLCPVKCCGAGQGSVADGFRLLLAHASEYASLLCVLLVSSLPSTAAFWQSFALDDHNRGCCRGSCHRTTRSGRGPHW